MTARHVGRRDAAAGGLAMLVLAAAAAGSAKAAELDGVLLTHCAEFQKINNELDRIWDQTGDMLMPEREVHPLTQREDEYSERYRDLRELITATPAKTPEGLLAKARVVLIELHDDDDDPSTALAVSFAKDLIGRAS